MREKIAAIVERLGYDRYGSADQILALFREEIEKLQPLSPKEVGCIAEEVMRSFGQCLGDKATDQGIARLVSRAVQAQLTKDKMDLRKVME